MAELEKASAGRSRFERVGLQSFNGKWSNWLPVEIYFAIQNSSIGDLVTHSILTTSFLQFLTIPFSQNFDIFYNSDNFTVFDKTRQWQQQFNVKDNPWDL